MHSTINNTNAVKIKGFMIKKKCEKISKEENHGTV